MDSHKNNIDGGNEGEVAHKGAKSPLKTKGWKNMRNKVLFRGQVKIISFNLGVFIQSSYRRFQKISN